MVMERSNSDYRGDREKSSAMMREEVAANRKEAASAAERVRKKINSHLALYLPRADSLLSGVKRPGAPLGLPLQLGPLLAENQRLKQELTAEQNFIDGMQRKSYELMVEIHKKYSIPIACLVFVMVGAPLGMMARRGSMAMAAGVSFGFFLLYWAFLIGGEELADNQMITPFMAMWLANLVVGAAGLYLVVHAIREATFFNPDAIRSFFSRLRRRPNNPISAQAAEHGQEL